MTPTERGLARMFAELWSIFVDGGGLDGYEVQTLIEDTGLVHWRPCTEEEAANSDMEPGEPAMFLTEEGKRIVGLGEAER